MAEWLTHWAYNNRYGSGSIPREIHYWEMISMGKPLCLVIEADTLTQPCTSCIPRYSSDLSSPKAGLFMSRAISEILSLVPIAKLV